MNKMNIFGILLLPLLTSCGSMKMGDPMLSAELKKFETKDNMTQVYICRNSKLMGSALRIKVELDGKPIATIGRSTFAYSELQPGNHTIISKTHAHDSAMEFTSKAGDQRFFQTWTSYGGLGIIDEIDVNAGKECVLNGELVETVAL